MFTSTEFASVAQVCGHKPKTPRVMIKIFPIAVVLGALLFPAGVFAEEGNGGDNEAMQMRKSVESVLKSALPLNSDALPVSPPNKPLLAPPPLPIADFPVLTGKNYKGYDIFKYEQMFIAILSQDELYIDLETLKKFLKRSTSKSASLQELQKILDTTPIVTPKKWLKSTTLASDTLQQLQKTLDTTPILTRPPLLSPTMEFPVLTDRDYKGYDLFKYRQVFYAILSQNESSIDAEALKKRLMSSKIKGASLEKIQAMLDRAPTVQAVPAQGVSANISEEKTEENPFLSENSNPSPPVLALEGYKGYNIVVYNDYFFGVSQGEGALDIPDLPRIKTKYPWFFDKTLEGVETKIDTCKPVEACSPAPPPPLWKRVLKRIRAII
jgi:hypothetical protein